MPKRKSTTNVSPRKTSRQSVPTKKAASASQSQPVESLENPSPALVNLIADMIGKAMDARESRLASQTATSVPIEVPVQDEAAVDQPQDYFSTDHAVADETMQRLLTGESQRVPQQFINPSPFGSASTFDHIYSVITNDLKAKMLKRDFFDLTQLVPKDKKNKSSAKILDVTCHGEANTMTFTTKEKAPEITSFEMWVMAFTKYASLRTSHFKEEGEGLFRHTHQVTKLYQAYPGSDAWLEYDLAYRQHLAAHAEFRWGDQLHDLVLYMQNKGMTDVQNTFRPQQNVNRPRFPSTSQFAAVPQGYCYQFHRHGVCQQHNCQYTHKCPFCFKNRGISHTHPMQRCSYKRSNLPPNKPRTTNAPSPKPGPSTTTPPPNANKPK